MVGLLCSRSQARSLMTCILSGLKVSWDMFDCFEQADRPIRCKIMFMYEPSRRTTDCQLNHM